MHRFLILMLSSIQAIAFAESCAHFVGVGKVIKSLQHPGHVIVINKNTKSEINLNVPEKFDFNMYPYINKSVHFEGQFILSSSYQGKLKSLEKVEFNDELSRDVFTKTKGSSCLSTDS